MNSLDSAIKAFRDSPSETNLNALRAEINRVEEKARMRARVEEKARMHALELDIKLAVLKYLGKA